MNAAAVQPQGPGRGPGLLLAHCATLGDHADRQPAYTRLEAAVGCDLARLLVFALAARRSSRVA